MYLQSPCFGSAFPTEGPFAAFPCPTVLWLPAWETLAPCPGTPPLAWRWLGPGERDIVAGAGVDAMGASAMNAAVVGVRALSMSSSLVVSCRHRLSRASTSRSAVMSKCFELGSSRVWQHIHRWLRTIPARNGCILAGDFNVAVEPEHPWCGRGVTPHQGQHQDRGEFQDLIRTHQCTILNSWRSGGARARTFLPPGVGAQHGEPRLGTQIDYIRGQLVDNQAKQAVPIQAHFVPDSGCRHLPVQASVPLPHRPMPVPPTPSKLSLALVRKHLRDTNSAELFMQDVAPQLAQASPQTNLDGVLLAGWKQTVGQSRRTTTAQAQPERQTGIRAEDSVRQLIHSMWQVRAELRRLQQPDRPEGEVPPLKSLWMAWHYAARLWAISRELRKQCHHRKMQKIQEVVASANVFQAAKQFGPKQPRRRWQPGGCDTNEGSRTSPDP